MKQKKDVSNPNINKIYLVNLLNIFLFANGILISYYKNVGLSYTQIFIIGVVYEVFNFLLEIPSGFIADLWSRKWCVTIGHLISGLSFVIIYFAPKTFLTFLFWSFLSAISSSLNSGTYTAIIYDSLFIQKQETEYMRIQAKINAIVLIAQTIALVIGGYIADNLGFEIILLISGIAGISQAIVFTFVKEPEIHTLNRKETIRLDDKIKEGLQKIKKIYKNLINNVSVLLISGFSILFYISSGYINTIQQPFFISIGFNSYITISIILALINVFSALCLFIYGKIVHKSKPCLIIYQALIFSIGIISLGLIHSKNIIINFFILNSILEIGNITLLELFNKKIPSSSRATLISTQNQINVVFSATFSICMGKVIDLVGINTANFVAGFSFMIIAVLLMFIFLKNRNRLNENKI